MTTTTERPVEQQSARPAVKPEALKLRIGRIAGVLLIVWGFWTIAGR